MPTVQEASGAPTPLGASLQAGLNNISYNQTVTFTKYVRVVLPLDGYIFWVKADQVSPSALLNAGLFNQTEFNAPPTIITPAATLTVKASVHMTTNQDQAQDETAGKNYMTVTTQSEIQDFNQIGNNVLFLGEFEGQTFAFNTIVGKYLQADIFHYRGFAVFPALRSQIVDDPRTLDLTNVVVSNSLPIWLTLNKFMPVFPSFLVDANLRPPYAAIHIGENDTDAIQSAPRLTRNMTHYQLARDKVRITIYGLRNFNALDFQDYVNQFTLDTDSLGIMNMPIMRDAKRTQSEMSVLAMKKVIDYEVNYYQTRVNDIARQLILSAFVTTLNPE